MAIEDLVAIAVKPLIKSNPTSQKQLLELFVHIVGPANTELPAGHDIFIQILVLYISVILGYFFIIVVNDDHVSGAQIYVSGRDRASCRCTRIKILIITQRATSMSGRACAIVENIPTLPALIEQLIISIHLLLRGIDLDEFPAHQFGQAGVKGDDIGQRRARSLQITVIPGHTVVEQLFVENAIRILDEGNTISDIRYKAQGKALISRQIISDTPHVQVHLCGITCIISGFDRFRISGNSVHVSDILGFVDDELQESGYQLILGSNQLPLVSPCRRLMVDVEPKHGIVVTMAFGPERYKYMQILASLHPAFPAGNILVLNPPLYRVSSLPH